MLVIARKVGTDEWVQIGPNVQVYVMSYRRGVVRLGIQAPPSVKILRGPEMANPDGSDKSPEA